MKRLGMFAALFTSAGLLGCSSQITMSEIPNSLPAGSAVDGIPFRTAKRYIAVVYEKRADGYKEVAQQPVTLPDPDRLFVVGLKAQLLANPTFDLVLNTDNTIQQISLKSTSKGSDALTALGTQANAIATAEAAKRTAADTAATKASAAAIAADKAKQAADLAELQYQSALTNPATSAEDLLKASQKARSAKLDANEAARLAGKPSYFPDVVP